MKEFTVLLILFVGLSVNVVSGLEVSGGRGEPGHYITVTNPGESVFSVHHPIFITPVADTPPALLLSPPATDAIVGHPMTAHTWTSLSNVHLRSDGTDVAACSDNRSLSRTMAIYDSASC